MANKKNVRKVNNLEHANVQKYVQSFEVAFDGYFRQENKSVITTLCLGTGASENEVKNFPFDACRNLTKKALRLAYPYMSPKKDGVRLFMSLSVSYYIEKAKVVNGTFNNEDVIEVHTFKPAIRFTNIFKKAEKNSLGTYVDKANKKKVAVKVPQIEVEENTFYLADNVTEAKFDSNKICWVIKDTENGGFKFAKGEFYKGTTSAAVKKAEIEKAKVASEKADKVAKEKAEKAKK